MTNLKSLLFLCFLGMGLLVSCVKDQDGIINNQLIVPDPQEIISTSLFGLVLDENDQPIRNAAVTLNSGLTTSVVMTDDLGQFAFEDIQNKGVSAFLSVQSSGKFEAFRRYGVIKDRNNYTEIKMQDKQIIGSVSASQGGILNNGNGAEIELPANGIITSSGAAYDGDVSVAMAWIDPTAADLASQMVGDLSAIDMEGNPRSLATYGMLQVELLDGAGNELNIAPGSTATLEFPVPSELRASAPANIPLWSYEEDLGTWLEEGSAVYENGAYRGSVTHFSSWNVDYPYDQIEITGDVKFNIESANVQGGFLSVYVQSDEIGKKGGWLCDDGSFRFYNFPKGVDFQLLILDQCGSVLYEETYGPFDNDEDLGAIVVEDTNEMIVIKGNALNCDNEVVANGSVSVKINNRNLYFETDEDGSFEIAVDVCKEGTGKVTIVDLESFLQADFDINNSQSVWEFDDTQLCDELEDFISISVDGGAPFVATPGVMFAVYQDSVNYETLIDLYWDFEDQNSFSSIYLGFTKSAQNPTYTTDAVGMYYVTNNHELTLDENGDIKVTITAYEEGDDGFIRGTFTGVAYNGLTGVSDIPIDGSFHVPIN